MKETSDLFLIFLFFCRTEDNYEERKPISKKYFKKPKKNENIFLN